MKKKLYNIPKEYKVWKYIQPMNLGVALVIATKDNEVRIFQFDLPEEPPTFIYKYRSFRPL